MSDRFGLNSGIEAPFLPASHSHHGHHRSMRGFGDFVTGLAKDAKDAGGNVVTGLVNDAKDAGGKVVTGLVNDAKDAVGDAIGGIFGGGGGGSKPNNAAQIEADRRYQDALYQARKAAYDKAREMPKLSQYSGQNAAQVNTSNPENKSITPLLLGAAAVAVAAYFYMKR